MDHLTNSAEERRRFANTSAILAERIETAIAGRSWSLDTSADPRCQAFFIVEGRAMVSFQDGTVADIIGPALVWFPVGQSGDFLVEAGGSGFRSAIAEPFVWRAIGDALADADMRRVMSDVLIANGDRIAHRLDDLWVAFDAMVQETRDPQPGSIALVGFHLGIVLMHLWRLGGVEVLEGHGGVPTNLVRRFRQLIELHFREGLGVGQYAGLLHVTRARLHDACTKITGLTPLATVHSRLLEEATTRLEQTSLSIEQVGFSLGFRDAAYFNRFFKRETGQTPGAYRRAARQAQQRAETGSFAAWP